MKKWFNILFKFDWVSKTLILNLDWRCNFSSVHCIYYINMKRIIRSCIGIHVIYNSSNLMNTKIIFKKDKILWGENTCNHIKFLNKFCQTIKIHTQKRKKQWIIKKKCYGYQILFFSFFLRYSNLLFTATQKKNNFF